MIIETDISTADLLAVLSRSGKPGTFNLLPEGKASPLSQALTTTLAKAGLAKPGKKSIELSGAGRIIADVLLTPQNYVQLSVWNDELEGNMRVAFPSSPSVGTGVVVNQSGNTVHLQGFVDDLALSDLVSPLVGRLPEAAPPFEASLSFVQSSILAAMIDMLVHDRRDRPESSRIRPVSAEAVAGWLDLLWASGPRSSLCGQVFSLSLDADPPTELVVQAVLEDLAKSQLLTSQDGAGNRYPTQTLLNLVEVLGRIDGGFDLERAERTENGPPAGRIIHVMIGPAGAFTLELEGVDRIHIKVADRAATVSVVASLLGESLTQKKSTGDPIGSDKPRDAVRNKFCVHCGKKIGPTWRYCISCGAAIGGKGT